MRTLLILAAVVVGIPATLYLFWLVHCALDSYCERHAHRFCRRIDLEVNRSRSTVAFEPSGVKTEFTIVELDCLNEQGQRRLIRLLVWPFGVRKVLTDEVYPSSFDQEWPQPND